jgi:hypothetical protein
MKLIQFDFSYKLILLIIQSVSRVIFMYLSNEYTVLIKNNNFNLFFLIEATLMLNIFFFLIQKHKSTQKSEIYEIIETNLEGYKILKSNLQEISNTLDFIPGNVEVEKIKLLFFSLFIAFCELTRDFLSMITLNPIRELFGIGSLFMIIYSHFIFKKELYSHHYLSIILIIIVCIFSIIFNLKTITLKSLLITFINYPLEVFLFFIMENLMKDKFLSPYILLTMLGFVSFLFLIASTIFLIIKFDFSKILDSNIEFIQKIFENINRTLKTIILFVSVFIYSDSVILTLYYFNTNYEMTSQIITIIINQCIKDFSFSNKIIIQIGNFIGVMIFSEIIILGCFNLGENTRKEIEKRSQYTETINLSLDNSNSNDLYENIN